MKTGCGDVFFLFHDFFFSFFFFCLLIIFCCLLSRPLSPSLLPLWQERSGQVCRPPRDTRDGGCIKGCGSVKGVLVVCRVFCVRFLCIFFCSCLSRLLIGRMVIGMRPPGNNGNACDYRDASTQASCVCFT